MVSGYEPCLCGAPDCRACFPQNFERIGRRNVCTYDLTDEQVQEIRENVEEVELDEC